MPKSFSHAKPFLPAWTLPILSLLVAVAVHGIWAVMPLHLPTPVQGVSAPFITAVTSGEVKDWTPVLFSLPSPDGFSSVVKHVTANVQAPLTSTLELTQRHALDASQFFDQKGLPAFSAGSHYTPVTVEAARVSKAESPLSTGWNLQVVGRPDFPLQFYRDIRIENPERVFELTGEMRFDSFGQVESLFFDPASSPAGVVRSVLPDLRLVRIPRAFAPARLRVRLTYQPQEGEE
jgi:hypothetical protein